MLRPKQRSKTYTYETSGLVMLESVDIMAAAIQSENEGRSYRLANDSTPAPATSLSIPNLFWLTQCTR